MAADLGVFSLYVRQTILDGLPTGFTIDQVKFPNNAFTPPINDVWLDADIKYTGRVRNTVGVPSYSIEGTVILGIRSPVDTHVISHEELVNNFRFLFDSIDATITGGKARFSPSFVVTNGVVESWYNTNILCNFNLEEFV